MSSWLESLKAAHKTQMIQDGKRKIHYTIGPGMEMAEEYDISTNQLVVRKWKKKTGVLGQDKWVFEVGEDVLPLSLESAGFMPSATNPVFVRKDTMKAFLWRIRNLPYPIETYDVQVDKASQSIVIKTTNKKYYKKFNIPDMERCNLELKPESLSIAHANNTLLVTYQKPPEIIEMETMLQQEFQKTKAMKDGDVECNPS